MMASVALCGVRTRDDEHGEREAAPLHPGMADVRAFALDWLVTGKHAADVLIVKTNQPTLHQQLQTLPWPDIPAQDHTRDRGMPAWSSAACRSPPWLAWRFPRHPGDADYPPGPVPAPPPLAHRDGVRGHQSHRRPGQPRAPGRLDPRDWGIEALHHLRDVTFAKDASQTPHQHRPTSHGQPA
jgi:hypothetical protein